jgi:uncharacterized protein (TIGR02231 family)
MPGVAGLFPKPEIQMKLTNTLAALGMVAFAPAAFCADIAVTLPIDSVIVYRDSAIVTRAGKTQVPAGEHRLVVRGLPDGLDPATLRLSARSASLKLGGIEVQRIIEGALVNADERALTLKLRDIGDARAAIEDDIVSAQAQLKLLEGVIAAPAGYGEHAPKIEPNAVGGLLTTVGTSDAAARQRIRNAKIQLRALDEQSEKIRGDLAKIATSRKATTELRATLHASADSSASFSVEYQVTSVSWNWQYEARLDTQKKSVALVRQAELQQGTGEDWSNIELTISTSQPSLNATTPPLASLFLNLQSLAYPGAGEDLNEVVVTGMRKSLARGDTARSAQPIMAQDLGAPAPPPVAPRTTAEMFTTDFIADYRIPGRVSVAADRQPRLYPIGDDTFGVDLVARANLAADRAAYLETRFTYEGDVPIDSGAVQLFRDDAFVGLGELPMVLPGADVRIPFGQDQRIRIVVRDESEDSGNVGVVNRDQLNERRRRFEITSFHASALPIEVIDRVPVARDDDIRIEVLKGATPPASKDFNGHAGVYLWRLAGEPRKTETIRHYYSVKFPRNKALAQVEGS